LVDFASLLRRWWVETEETLVCHDSAGSGNAMYVECIPRGEGAMWRVLLICYVVTALSFAGLTWAQPARAEEAVERAIPQEAKELDVEREVDALFAQKCLVCHDRTSVDLEASSVSLAEWMHVVNWMREMAPEFITEDEAAKLRRGYVERIREQIEQIEENLKSLRGLLNP